VTVTTQPVYRCTPGPLHATLLAGTVPFGLLNLIRAEHKGGRALVYFLVLLATWLLGLVNAFEHAKDAWAVMPSGLVLSVIVSALACIATWIGLTNLRSGGAQ